MTQDLRITTADGTSMLLSQMSPEQLQEFIRLRRTRRHGA